MNKFVHVKQRIDCIYLLFALFNTQSSNNVVVVSQPSAAQPQTVVVERVRPNDNLIWVLCLMVVCFCTGNFVAFVCLIPALVLSLSVSQPLALSVL